MCVGGLMGAVRSYFDQIDAIKKKDYVPSVDDIIRLRVTTTGITETTFTYQNFNLRYG